MARVLVVDDERGMRLSLGAFLKNDGHEVQTAETVDAAMSVLETFEADVVVSDIIMPGPTGVQLLAQVRERNRGQEVILLTGEPNVETASEAVRNGAFDYLTKPITKDALLAAVARAARAKAQHDLTSRVLEENERYRTSLEELVKTRTAQLSNALRGTIGVVTQTMETRDPYTAGHQRRVAGLSLALANELGLPADLVEGIEMAALVHDIGKIAVPAEILAKPTRLTSIELQLVREHARVGYEILQKVEFPWPIAQTVLQHHERLDGSGYPAGLVGDAIAQGARIIGVADVVEAMASHRPYRAALGMEAALDEISRNRGRHYDPSVVDACLRLFMEKKYTLLA